MTFDTTSEISKKINKIVIVGGGTAGWMTAAAFSNRIPNSHCKIILIESEQIATVGVGESTIPHIRQFNEVLGISETEFIQATNATFKLGIQFCNWGRLGDDYIHPFGEVGELTQGIDFHHYWLRSKELGLPYNFEDFSLMAKAGRQGLFPKAETLKETKFSDYAYSYHIDATAYAKFLRNYAEKKGVERIEGKVIDVLQHENGNIKAVDLENNHLIDGDIFIDCTGFSGLLIDKTLNSEFISWADWLPTNRAVVVQSERAGPIIPMTTATAHSAGWQWSIPLQHRMGNGHVYASDYMSDEQAKKILLENISEPLVTEPRFLSFEAGVRTKTWSNNCVAIGLSSGFLEPLESTSIYLIQYGIFKFLEYLPSSMAMSAEREQYNQEVKSVYETIRDFIILHYHVNQRTDSKFWIRQREMSIPESLERKLGLFAESGRLDLGQFGVWPSVCLGQNLAPKYYDSRLNCIGKEQLSQFLKQQKMLVDNALNQLPSVEQYLSMITVDFNNFVRGE